MVKIGKWVLFEKTKSVTEQFKAGVDTGYGAKPTRKTFALGEHSWLSRCRHFNKLAEEYPLFNQSCLGIAGLVMSQGTFLSPAVKKNDETYPLAEEALWRVEKLNQQMRVNSKFYDTVYHMAKFGSAFWEVTFTPTFAFRPAPFPESIEPYEVNEIGEIIRWRQVINGAVKAEWPSEPSTNETYLVNVSWNVTTATWPYGTSLGVGSETELEALINMEDDAKDYMEKQAWPYEVLALGDKDTNVSASDYSTARTQWKNRSPGEGIVARNMPVQIIPGGTGSAPIRELAVLCQLMKDNVHDGLMVPPISKLYNSTEASAKVLTGHIMSILGQPMQWILKECYEEFVLKPYLENSGFSVKSCPQLLFESPDVHKAEEGEYWTSLVGAGIQSPKQAAEHLGLEFDEEYWIQKQQRQMDLMKQKSQTFGQAKPEQKEEANAKAFAERG